MSHYLLKNGSCSKACPACDRIRAEAQAEGAAEEREAVLFIVADTLDAARDAMDGKLCTPGQVPEFEAIAGAAEVILARIRTRGPHVAPKDEAREKALEALKRVRHRPDSLSGSVCHCPDCDVIDEAIALLSK